MGLVYHSTILIVAVAVPVFLILLTLLLPICFRDCYNKNGCWRVTCRCNYAKPKNKKYEDEKFGEFHSPNLEYDGDDRYARLFEPSIYAQVFMLINIGFIFVVISALTDVPFYVMTIIFALVWILLVTDFVRRHYSEGVIDGDIVLVDQKPKEKKKESEKDKEEELYEAAGIVRHKFKKSVRKYFSDTKGGLKMYPFQYALAVLVVLIIAGAATALSSCMCIAASPVSASTWLSRLWSHKYCVPGEVCNVYFTLADTEHDLIMNFHASEKPDFAYVAYDLKSHPQNSSESVEQWVDSYMFNATATTYKMNTVRELTRYVNWADISNLKANTYYFFVAVYIINGKTVASSEYKVRTLPSDGNYTFITGGDMSMDGAARKLINLAADTNPHFAIIGGDNAYDNGFKSCYRRWDEWFSRWNDLMTRNGTTMPVMLGIGNHEAGNFGRNLGDDPYYTPYFPQQLGLQTVDPRKRMPYHVHRFGANSTFIMLDSDVVVRVDGEQTTWLETQLKVPSRFKVVIYHANIYPSADLSKIPTSHGVLTDKGKKYWTPLFDQYNVTVAFENHLHLYKRTKPLRADVVNPDGVVYLGDGTWGVEPNIVPLSSEYYIEKVARTQFFFSVAVQYDTNITVNAINKNGDIFDTWNRTLHK